MMGVMALSLILPTLALAGGDQVQYGRPRPATCLQGDGDRTDGDWGNPANNG